MVFVLQLDLIETVNIGMTDIIEATLLTKRVAPADILSQTHQQGMIFIE